MSFPGKGKSSNCCYNLGSYFLISMFSHHSTCWDLFVVRKWFGNIIFTGHNSAICFSQLPLITFVTLQGKVQTFIRLQNRSLRGLILAKLIKGSSGLKKKKKRQSLETKTSGQSFRNKLPGIPENGRVESWQTNQGTHVGLPVYILQPTFYLILCWSDIKKIGIIFSGLLFFNFMLEWCRRKIKTRKTRKKLDIWGIGSGNRISILGWLVGPDSFYFLTKMELQWKHKEKNKVIHIFTFAM